MSDDGTCTGRARNQTRALLAFIWSLEPDIARGRSQTAIYCFTDDPVGAVGIETRDALTIIM